MIDKLTDEQLDHLQERLDERKAYHEARQLENQEEADMSMHLDYHCEQCNSHLTNRERKKQRKCDNCGARFTR